MNSIDENYQTTNAAIPRSKSAHALKLNGDNQLDEHVVALSQLLWIAVSMMESDYEHEYLLALRLFEKVCFNLYICVGYTIFMKHNFYGFKLLDLSANERQDCFDRFERMVKQLDWFNFPGLLSLVLKVSFSHYLTLSV